MAITHFLHPAKLERTPVRGRLSAISGLSVSSINTTFTREVEATIDPLRTSVGLGI